MRPHRLCWQAACVVAAVFTSSAVPCRAVPIRVTFENQTGAGWEFAELDLVGNITSMSVLDVDDDGIESFVVDVDPGTEVASHVSTGPASCSYVHIELFVTDDDEMNVFIYPSISILSLTILVLINLGY